MVRGFNVFSAWNVLQTHHESLFCGGDLNMCWLMCIRKPWPHPKKTTKLLNESLPIHFAKRLLVFFVGHWKRAFPVRWVTFSHPKLPLCWFFSYIPPVQKRLLNQQSPKSHGKKSLHETVDGSETQQSSWDCYPVILGERLGSPGMMHLPTKWGAVQNPRILKITG